MKKIIALLLVLAMTLSFAACGGSDTEPETTTLADETTLEVQPADATIADLTTLEGETTLEGQTTLEGETTLEGQTTLEGETTLEGQTTLEATTAAAAAEAKLPETKEEIVAAYTLVMNKAKTSKVGYKKVEYQVLPENKRNIDGNGISTILKLAGLFMTSENKAKENPEVKDKGGDCRWFPVYKSDKGCLLTNANDVKSASSQKLSNGNYKITFVMKDESNPEPYNEKTKTSPSALGKVFSPLSRANDIDPVLVNDSRINKVVKNINYDLLYQGCKVTLVYNPKTNQVISLDQYTNVLITASGTLALLGDFSGTAVLENFMSISNVKY